jgi:hypothetical protein
MDTSWNKINWKAIRDFRVKNEIEEGELHAWAEEMKKQGFESGLPKSSKDDSNSKEYLVIENGEMTVASYDSWNNSPVFWAQGEEMIEPEYWAELPKKPKNCKKNFSYLK